MEGPFLPQSLPHPDKWNTPIPTHSWQPPLLPHHQPQQSGDPRSLEALGLLCPLPDSLLPSSSPTGCFSTFGTWLKACFSRPLKHRPHLASLASSHYCFLSQSLPLSARISFLYYFIHLSNSDTTRYFQVCLSCAHYWISIPRKPPGIPTGV